MMLSRVFREEETQDTPFFAFASSKRWQAGGRPVSDPEAEFVASIVVESLFRKMTVL